ncbi:undecaprenyl-phosphate galactose phosphotransferase [Levilactobacillus namurensis DSM 19117]|uniref:Undecaprenyl-phosphate galactose phosphotransferase n=1 Tax=Levilactobacillus namurensis DSM 19117 TaxID=1423773 RepID=A0A0R1JVF3_9LACO|nr:sugar transferase [Levilactobacillus namurensis]KRK72681.1 undecaprenyl-phosphate galactose phosphotransferase [Levilactobacillus namurensis DSM 19117]
MDYSSHYPSLYLFEKRAFDIIISSIALIILSPLFLIILLLNIFSKDNQGPLFYRQERMGLHGKKFKMYKFRSMVVNAEEKLYENPELYSAYVANSFKLEPSDDPRITKLGLFLRKTSIDEIPQFINIIKGDMTLIGPRPVIEQELIEYDVSKLLSVKPGAMGLWQASGRSDIGYPERANIEMQYIDEACLKVDFKIFCKNILKVLSRKGAY